MWESYTRHRIQTQCIYILIECSATCLLLSAYSCSRLAMMAGLFAGASRVLTISLPFFRRFMKRFGPRIAKLRPGQGRSPSPSCCCEETQRRGGTRRTRNLMRGRLHLIRQHIDVVVELVDDLAHRSIRIRATPQPFRRCVAPVASAQASIAEALAHVGKALESEIRPRKRGECLPSRLARNKSATGLRFVRNIHHRNPYPPGHTATQASWDLQPG